MQSTIVNASVSIASVVLVLGMCVGGVMILRRVRERRRRATQLRTSAAAVAAVADSFDEDGDLTLDEALNAVDSVHRINRGRPTGGGGQRAPGAARSTGTSQTASLAAPESSRRAEAVAVRVHADPPARQVRATRGATSGNGAPPPSIQVSTTASGAGERAEGRLLSGRAVEVQSGLLVEEEDED